MKNTTDKTILVPLISDGPNTGFKVVRNPDYIGPREPSQSPSYTLAELMELGHEWARSTGGELTDDMAVSWFLLWLGKKEREGE